MSNTNTSTIGSCIIVVGGGPAGIDVARAAIAKHQSRATVNVTIVDRQNYMDWSLASPRMLVAPDDIDKYGYIMPLKEVCDFVGTYRRGSKRTKFVQGAVDTPQ
jgi:NADH dehydrogenase FAD-containing subunit